MEQDSNFNRRIKLFDKYYIKPELEQELQEFFRIVFQSLEQELNHIASKIFLKSIDATFDTIEQCWLGWLNNAIVRAFPDRAATLLEFSVPVAPKKYVRADFFVRWRAKYGDIDLLFEAKGEPESGRDYPADKLEAWYDQLLKKGLFYYNGEKDDYLSRTYIIAIVFGWIRNEIALNKVKTQMDKFVRAQNDSSDFCALYHGLDAGTLLYGRVKNIEEFLIEESITSNP